MKMPKVSKLPKMPKIMARLRRIGFTTMLQFYFSRRQLQFKEV